MNQFRILEDRFPRGIVRKISGGRIKGTIFLTEASSEKGQTIERRIQMRMIREELKTMSWKGDDMPLHLC